MLLSFYFHIKSFSWCATERVGEALWSNESLSVVFFVLLSDHATVMAPFLLE